MYERRRSSQGNIALMILCNIVLGALSYLSLKNNLLLAQFTSARGQASDRLLASQKREKSLKLKIRR